MPEEPTTSDLVELTRRVIEAPGLRDFDAAMSFFREDSVWDASALGVGTFRGVERIRHQLKHWVGSFERCEIEVEELQDLGEGVIFAVILQSARPPGSGGTVEMRIAAVHQWKARMIVRVTAFIDIDEARAVAERLPRERGWTMSRNRAQTVRALIERWNAGHHGAEAFPEYFDPSIELESPFSTVVGEPYRGYVGIERWVSDLDEQFTAWSITPDEVRQIGSQVIAISTVEARGRASDITMHFPAGGVFDFTSDDRVKRARIYADVNEALKAVGLES